MSSNSIRSLWQRTNSLPAGNLIFSRLLGRFVPYTGTIGPRVEALSDGYARVSMRDRRRVRNHLNSIHAIAIMNLAEVAGGLALNYGLPSGARAILMSLGIDYLKKGRGTLTAEARIELPDTTQRAEYEFETIVRDRSGEVVARVRARWLVGPEEERVGDAPG
ncbi:MAG TPA: hotdog fold domain-containing protein [Longimicrobiaceae bacterium]